MPFFRRKFQHQAGLQVLQVLFAPISPPAPPRERSREAAGHMNTPGRRRTTDDARCVAGGS